MKDKRKEAVRLFQFGYEDSVIAGRTGLVERYVADLRKAWEECEKQ